MYSTKGKRVPRVLIADDDPVIRRWVTSILVSEGYDVVSVSDGREVYRLLQSDADFEGAVLDLTMPYLDGPDLIRYMRSEKRLMRIPVMMITAETQAKLVASGLAAGATILLPKPFHRAQLQNTLRMMLGTEPEGKKSSLPTSDRKSSFTSVPLPREPPVGKFATLIEKSNTMAPANQPIDLRVLMDLGIGDDEEASDLITELINLYLENAEKEVKAIQVAAREHNEGSIKERAHALKGSSATIGACRIARLCERLEAQNANGSLDLLVNELESELASARTVLLADRGERLQLVSA